VFYCAPTRQIHVPVDWLSAIESRIGIKTCLYSSLTANVLGGKGKNVKVISVL